MAQESIAAQDGLRSYNLGRVLGHVHRAGSVSRSDLATATGLNRSTIGTLVAELHGRGLVEEVKPPPGTDRTPGRPSPLVQAHGDGVTVLACDISVDSLSCAIFGLGGRLYATASVKRSRSRMSPAETLSDMAEVIEAVRPQVSGERLVAVGVGIPGVVSQPDGVVRIAPDLGWDDVPLAEMIRERFGLDVPIRISNDANLGAVAEHARGAGAGIDDFIYLSSEVGVGAGVIVDGQLLQGADGHAAEAGHMLVNPNGLICTCGGRGCWETEVGERALLRAAGMPMDGGVESLATLFRKAETGNPEMLYALTEVGRWLGLGLVTLISLFNPRKVILGGVYVRAFPFMASIAEETIARRCQLPSGGVVRLVPSPLAELAVLFGAAEIALADVLSDPGGLQLFQERPGSRLPEPVFVAHSDVAKRRAVQGQRPHEQETA